MTIECYCVVFFLPFHSMFVEGVSAKSCGIAAMAFGAELRELGYKGDLYIICR